MQWSRVAWALIFGIGMFALAQIMLLPESGKFLRSSAPLLTTLALFAGFGLTSVAFRAYFRYRRAPKTVTSSVCSRRMSARFLICFLPTRREDGLSRRLRPSRISRGVELSVPVLSTRSEGWG